MTKNGKPPRKPILSYSQILTFLRCPLQYYYSYIRKIKTPGEAGRAIGTSFHEVCEANFSQKIKTRKDLPLEELERIFNDAFDREMNSPLTRLKPNDSIPDLNALGIRIVNKWAVDIAPTIQPIAVEQKFIVSLGDDFPFELLGYFDLITENRRIRDQKVYSPFRMNITQDIVDRDLQLSIYSLAYRLMYGEIEAGIDLDIIFKDRKLSRRVYQTQRSNNHLYWILGLIRKAGRSILAGEFYPQPIGDHCSEKMCGHWVRCIEDISATGGANNVETGNTGRREGSSTPAGAGQQSTEAARESGLAVQKTG